MGTLEYFILPLLDHPDEQIVRHFYPVISTMDEGAREAKSMLVHCHQGVSRSCTLVLAYLMWSQGFTYDQAFHSLREARGVGQPNIGFICQLMDWDKRRAAALHGTATQHVVYVAFPSAADQHDSFPCTPWMVKPH